MVILTALYVLHSKSDLCHVWVSYLGSAIMNPFKTLQILFVLGETVLLEVISLRTESVV